MSILQQNISQAAQIIKSGGLVAFPTETVYGLGADALNSQAVAKIFEAKKRPFFDPLICHIADIDLLHKISINIPATAFDLIESFWPGPLTLILQKSGIVPDIVTSGLSTVAVRMPANEIALELIKNSQTPIAAPSANPFGYLSPTTASHVKEAFDDEIDMIIDGGSCTVGVESTIIKVSEDGNYYMLRPGGLEIEKIEKVICKKVKTDIENVSESPGLLPDHYAPHSDLKIISRHETASNLKNNSCLLSYSLPRNLSHIKKELILAPDGKTRTAAANLFEYLHILDSFNSEIIYVEEVPQEGLGLAIMNRLEKASTDKN